MKKAHEVTFEAITFQTARQACLAYKRAAKRFAHAMIGGQRLSRAIVTIRVEIVEDEKP